jgi:hypothetical protein
VKLWIALGALGVLLMFFGLSVSPFVCARPDVPCPSPTWAELTFYLGGVDLAAAIVLPALLAVRSALRAQRQSGRYPPPSDIRRR